MTTQTPDRRKARSHSRQNEAKYIRFLKAHSAAVGDWATVEKCDTALARITTAEEIA